MKGKLLSILFLVLGVSLCEGQSWVWGREAIPSAHAVGETLGDHSTAVDASGNVFTTSYFRDTLSFGAYTLIAPNPPGNILLVKYDSAGNVLWAKQSYPANVFSWASGIAVAVDDSGNAYLTGEFADTIRLGTFSLFSKWPSSVFLAKYDATGNVLWVKQANTISKDCWGVGYSVSMDVSGNSYVTGTFMDTLIFGTFTLTNDHQIDVFLVKYDANGNVLWAKQSNAAKQEGYGGEAFSMATDALGNTYLTGVFYDTLSFGTYTLISNGMDGDIFIAKYDANGNVLWAKQANVASSKSHAVGTSIALEASGSCYITGEFIDTISFGASTLISPYGDVFLAKYGTSGNPLWVKQGKTVGSNSFIALSLACDSLKRGGGLLAVSGGITLSNNLGFLNDTFSSNYIPMSILIQFDSSGKALCGTIYSEDGEDDGDGVGVDLSGKYIYLGGDLNGPSVFGKDTLNYGVGDVPFVARWQPCNTNTEGINKITSPLSSLSLFPNPSPGLFTMQLSVVSSQWSVEIYNVMGQRIQTSSFPSAMGEGTSFTYTINLSSQPNGVYFYRVISEDGSVLGSGKMVVQK